MSANDLAGHDGKQDLSSYFAPGVAIDSPGSENTFRQALFERYFIANFGARDDLYKQLRQFLKTHSINSQDLLGRDSSYREASTDLLKFEQAKLAVLAAEMSCRNRKWSAQVRLVRPSMSALLGGSAPSSIRKTENDRLLGYYLRELKSGIPDSEQASARPLLDGPDPREFAGGYFEVRTIEMSRDVANFITGRQRQRVVEQNITEGWSDPLDGVLFWPGHVSPDYRADEAMEAARAALITLHRLTPPDADKDMARVRLLKDFFLDSEASHWQEMYELYSSVQVSMPAEIGLIDLRLSRDQIREVVTSAFDAPISRMPEALVQQAECLVWLYTLRHDPFGPNSATPARRDYYRKMQQPHYIALAAAILFHLRETGVCTRIAIAGESHPNVAVYRSFMDALGEARVDPALGPEANASALRTMLQSMDTKALNHVVSLFSLAANAEDPRAPFLRMDYFKAHARLKVERVRLLAELPQWLKAFRCTTAYALMAAYMSGLRACGANPFIEPGANA